MSIEDEYKKAKAVETADNAKVLIEHLNLSSIRQFAAVIDAPVSSVSRWIRKYPVKQGVQPADFFWRVYERFGMFGLEVLFTGRVNGNRSIVAAIGKLTLDEALEAQQLLISHVANLSRGHRIQPD